MSGACRQYATCGHAGNACQLTEAAAWLRDVLRLDNYTVYTKLAATSQHMVRMQCTGNDLMAKSRRCSLIYGLAGLQLN